MGFKKMSWLWLNLAGAKTEKTPFCEQIFDAHWPKN